MLNGFGMFNALMMSYTRVPYAMAEEGVLPVALGRTTRAGVPWVSVVLCSVAWALALRFSFERLISIDLVLYGGALVLEFVALVMLRLREPELRRPFQVPGGVWGAIGVGVGPALLIGYALWAARDERVAGMPALGFAALVGAAGPLAYGLARWGQWRRERLAA
jgi:amino acid transporter